MLCVARLDEQKDHRTLFAAMERMRTGRRFHVVLMGRGPLEDELRGAAPVLAHAGVTLAGFVADPGGAFDAADVVVLSSTWEGFGLVLAEAGLHGRPVVATEVGGIPEVVKDGVNGLLVPPRDPDALAAALDRLLDDEALARRMGEAGRERARERFSVRVYVDKVEALYERLLGARE